MEPIRRPRIVKRVPFYRRIINAPEDYLLKFENDIRSLDWDRLQEGFSWPLAIALNLLLVSVKLGYWLDDPLANIPTILRNDRAYYSSRSMRPAFASLLTYLQYILIAISFINALWLFQSKKNYKMLNRDPDDRPSSSNVKMVELQTEETNHWGSRFLGKLVYPFISPFMRNSKNEQSKLHVWEMSIWDPSILSRNLFCWYSPAQVLVMAGISSENVHLFLPLAIIVGLQVHFLVSVYQSFVKDKQVLFEEVSKEYNSKFVYPRIFVQKHDKNVSTETDTFDPLPESRDQTSSFAFTSDRKQRNFQHLSVPASRFSPHLTNNLRARGNQSPSDSRASSSINSDEENEDEEDEDGDDEDELDEEEEEGEGEEETSEDEDEDNESDNPDVEPAIPHPTNSLNF